MERLLKLIPIRYDSYRDMAETKEFAVQINNIKNMIELHKLGGKVTIPKFEYDADAMIKLHSNDISDSTSLRLMKKYYQPTKNKIHSELMYIFNEVFYGSLGYKNFSHVCAKADSGYYVATIKEDDRYKFITTDEQTFYLLAYIGSVFGQAETLAIRNELIK